MGIEAELKVRVRDPARVRVGTPTSRPPLFRLCQLVLSGRPRRGDQALSG